MPEQPASPEIDDPEEVVKAVSLLDLEDQSGDVISKGPSVGADVSGRSASAGGPFISQPPVRDLGLLLDESFVGSLMMTERTKSQFPVEMALGPARDSSSPSLPPFLIEPPIPSARRTVAAASFDDSPVSGRRESTSRSGHEASRSLASAAVLDEALALGKADKEPSRDSSEISGSAPPHREATARFWSGLEGPSWKSWASEETVAVAGPRAIEISLPPPASQEAAPTVDPRFESGSRATFNEPGISHGAASLASLNLDPIEAHARRSAAEDRPAGAHAGLRAVDDSWGSWIDEYTRADLPRSMGKRPRAILRALASMAIPGWGQALNEQHGKARAFRIAAFMTLVFGDLLIFRATVAGWSDALASLGSARAPTWLMLPFFAGVVSWILSAYDAYLVTTYRT